jgi:hypothetical protein
MKLTVILAILMKGLIVFALQVVRNLSSDIKTDNTILSVAKSFIQQKNRQTTVEEPSLHQLFLSFVSDYV